MARQGDLVRHTDTLVLSVSCVADKNPEAPYVNLSHALSHSRFRPHSLLLLLLLFSIFLFLVMCERNPSHNRFLFFQTSSCYYSVIWEFAEQHVYFLCPHIFVTPSQSREKTSIPSWLKHKCFSPCHSDVIFIHKKKKHFSCHIAANKTRLAKLLCLLVIQSDFKIAPHSDLTSKTLVNQLVNIMLFIMF